MESFLELYTQNNKLAIRLISPGFGHLPAAITNGFGFPHRKPYYFFLFILEGQSQQNVDLQQFQIEQNDLFFILPHQIHQLTSKRAANYFKIGFDENCLSLLPKQYPFLINPSNNQKIKFEPAAAARLKLIFELLLELLKKVDTDPELVLAHLNSLLTEINTAYFSTHKNPADDKLSKFIRFKLLIENTFTDHPTIEDIAKKLALNSNSLYSIVKHYSGVSPKEFLKKRLILEAKRRLCYSESSSIKELAYDLGFNDPEYFARLFKKETGRSIALFTQELSGK